MADFVFLRWFFRSECGIRRGSAPTAAHLIRDLMMIPRKEKERIFAALPISQLGGGFYYQNICGHFMLPDKMTLLGID